MKGKINVAIVIPSRTDLQAVVAQDTQRDEDELMELVVAFIEHDAGGVLAGQSIEIDLNNRFKDRRVERVINRLNLSGHYAASHVQQGSRNYITLVLL